MRFLQHVPSDLMSRTSETRLFPIFSAVAFSHASSASVPLLLLITHSVSLFSSEASRECLSIAPMRLH